MNSVAKRLMALASLGFAAILASTQDVRAVVVTAALDGNDCSGYFGQGFDACTIFSDDNGTRIELSPVILKFNQDLSDPEINSAVYSTIDGSEFSFSKTESGNGAGTWTYTAGAGDPGIKFWVAKASNEFILYWDVAAALTQPLGVCSATSGSANYNLTCLQAANIVTSASWTTPLNNKGEPRELSHLTIYDTKPPHVVPEPAMLLLLGSGLVGLGYALRRRPQV